MARLSPLIPTHPSTSLSVCLCRQVQKTGAVPLPAIPPVTPFSPPPLVALPQHARARIVSYSCVSACGQRSVQYCPWEIKHVEPMLGFLSDYPLHVCV